jgi:hypothetical protein
VVGQDESSNQHHSQEEAQCTSGSEHLTRIKDEEDGQRFDDEPTAAVLDAELEHERGPLI